MTKHKTRNTSPEAAFTLRTLPLLIALAFAPAAAAQVIPIVNVPADINANATGGITTFKPGSYSATDTATWDGSTWTPAFPGNLALGDGTSLAASGTGTNKAGLAVTGTFTQNGGSINATGNNYGYGIWANTSFTQNSGSINATGNNHGVGIWARNAFTQNGGSINATGNDGSGIWARNAFTQNGGSITATGNNGGYGIYAINTFTQNGGSITATGNNGIGIYADTTFEQHGGTLRLMPNNGSGYALYVSSSASLSGTLAPVMDVASTGKVGLMNAPRGTITINPGAQLAPEFTNTGSLAVNTSTGGKTFMTALGSGGVSGTFANETGATPTLTWTATNNGDTYHLDVSRTNTLTGALAGSAGPNAMRLISAIEGVNLAGGGNTGTNGVQDYLDNSPDMAALRSRANFAAQSSTPQGTTRVARMAMHQFDAIDTAFTGNLRQLAYGGTNVNGMTTAAAPAATMTDAGTGKRSGLAWATPVYRTGTIHAHTAEFTKADEDFGGIAIGAGRVVGDVSFGGQIHYLNGQLKSSGSPYYKAETDTYGFTVGARVDRLLPTYDVGNNSTWVQGSVGYSRENLDQKRGDLMGSVHKSSPDADLFRISASVGRDIAARRTRISPAFGFDYTHVSMDSYREGNDNGFALDVKAKDFDSFRLKLGAQVETPIYGNLSLVGGAFWRYELMDRNMRMESAFAGVPGSFFATSGEEIDRNSGEFNIGVKYQATDRVSFGAGYGLTIEDGYTGHQFGLNLAVKF